MTTADRIKNQISQFHLLKHAFYQAWNEGRLEQDTLKTYARQYFQHVDAFPRYISATHSNCKDIRARQFLLENLNDEEKGDKNHPELWMRFGEGLGESRENMRSEEMFPETKKLVDTMMGLSKSSFEKGLGALFAYEYQVPEIAANKIEGLEKFYGINDVRTLEFFEVHRLADIYHSKAVAEIIEDLSDDQKAEVQEGAEKASRALWDFLTGICRQSSGEFEETEIAQAANA